MVGSILSSVARRWVYWAPAIVLLAAGIGGGVWWHRQANERSYATAAVTRGDIQLTINMTGAINPVVTVQVGSYVSGIVKWLGCDFNTEVKVGQVCARLDPQPFQMVVDQDRADVASGEAQLAKDRAALAYIRLNFQRDSKLLESGVVAQDTVDSDRSNFEQATAQVALDEASIAQRRANLKAAEVNLGYTAIVAPVDGTVITRNVDVGQTVVTSLESSTLFLIAKDLTRMQVDTNVSESDISAVKPGQKVSFTVQAYPDRTFRGTVSQVRQGPITVQSVVTYDVVVSVDNPDRALLPGMTADTHIITDERTGVLRVPSAAVRFVPAGVGRSRHRAEEGDHAPRQQGERGHRPRSRVWVMKDGHPVPVPVVTGLDDHTLIEISGDGIQPGDEVIVGEERTEQRRPAPAESQQIFRRPRF